MNTAAQFLKDCGTFYLATNENDQPRVRPFGAIMEYNGKIYICTNNKKDCFKQIVKNPKVEISGMKGGKWIRVCGELAADPSKDAKDHMLKEYPSLERMYSLEDGIFEVLYFKNAKATIYSLQGEAESFEL